MANVRPGWAHSLVEIKIRVALTVTCLPKDKQIFFGSRENMSGSTGTAPVAAFDDLVLLAERELDVQLRAHQREGLQAVHDGADAIISVETGGGKTMIAIIAPYLFGWTRGAAPQQLPLIVVLVPLRALAAGHAATFRAAGYTVLDASSDTLSSEEQERVFDGHLHGVTHVFVSPERVLSPQWLRCMAEGDVKSRVKLIVDEAHVVPMWGVARNDHTAPFREAYGNLFRLRMRLPDVPVVALTATDPPEIRDAMVRLLALRHPRLVSLPFARSNLYYRVLVERVRGRRLPGDHQIIVDLADEIVRLRQQTPYTIIFFIRTLNDLNMLFSVFRILVEDVDESAIAHVKKFIGPGPS